MIPTITVPAPSQKPSFHYTLILFTFILIVFGAGFFMYYSQTQKKITDLQLTLDKVRAKVYIPDLTDEEKREDLQKKEVEYFITEVYPNNPLISEFIPDPATITSVHPIQLDRIVTTGDHGFLVRQDEIIDLDLTPESLGCYLIDIDKIQIISSMTVGDSYPQKSFAISGSCSAQGFSNFTGLYDLKTGRHIELKNLSNKRFTGYLKSTVISGKGFAGGDLYTEVPDYTHSITVLYPNAGFATFDSVSGKLLNTLFFSDR